MNKQLVVLTTILIASCSGSAVFADQSLPSKRSMEALSRATARVDAGVGRALSQSLAGCAPDQPTPVWDASNHLLGYRCEQPNSN